MSRLTLTRIWVSGSPDDGTSQVALQVSTRLLEAVGAHLLQGRAFTSADETSVSTVIVNKPFADKFLQGQAVGRVPGHQQRGGRQVHQHGTKTQ